MVGKGLGFTGRDSIFQIITFAALPFAALKLALSKWTRKELLVCIILNLIGVAVWIFSGDTSILLTTITVTACKDMDIYNIFKLSFWIRGIIFVVMTSLAIARKIDIQYRVRYFNGEIDVRYALGYDQPNAAHYTLFVVVVLALIAYHNRMKLYHYAALLAYNLFIFKYTDSRTGVSLTALVLILVYILDRWHVLTLRRLIERLGKYSYILATVGSFAICFLLATVPLLQSFETLSSRFATGTDVIRNNSLSLFGKPGIVTDFGYIAILYGNGIIVFALFITGMTLLFKMCQKYNMYVESAVMTVYAIYTLSEAYTGSVLMNLCLMFLACIIYPKSRKKLLSTHIKDQKRFRKKPNKKRYMRKIKIR